MSIDATISDDATTDVLGLDSTYVDPWYLLRISSRFHPEHAALGSAHRPLVRAYSPNAGTATVGLGHIYAEGAVGSTSAVTTGHLGCPYCSGVAQGTGYLLGPNDWSQYTRSDSAHHVEPWGPAPVASMLSARFWGRLLTFVEWAPNWDGHGAEHVSRETAERAAHVAEQVYGVAREPFVAPAGDGTLLLQWDFRGGVSVETFVGPPGSVWEAAVETLDGHSSEVPIGSLADLRKTLVRARTAAAAP